MNPKIIGKEILAYNKGKSFISLNAIRLWLGIGTNKAADLVKGLETFDNKYFFLDVAERVCERNVQK